MCNHHLTQADIRRNNNFTTTAFVLWLSLTDDTNYTQLHSQLHRWHIKYNRKWVVALIATSNNRCVAFGLIEFIQNIFCGENCVCKMHIDIVSPVYTKAHSVAVVTVTNEFITTNGVWKFHAILPPNRISPECRESLNFWECHHW